MREQGIIEPQGKPLTFPTFLERKKVASTEQGYSPITKNDDSLDSLVGAK